MAVTLNHHSNHRSNHPSNPVMYNLVFSRNRSNDSPVVFGDVTVPEESLMIEILSFRSNFQRSAGWLYPARPAGNGVFERGRGVRLMYGKNRVVFQDFPPPYNLEFFPEIGRFPYIISVYTGTPSPEIVDGWVPYPARNLAFKLFLSNTKIQSRRLAERDSQSDVLSPVSEGFFTSTHVYGNFFNQNWYRQAIGQPENREVITKGSYDAALAQSGSTVIPPAQ